MKNALLFSLSCLCMAAPARAQGYRLNDPLARSALGGVNSFQLDPTGTHVLFLADLDPAQSNPQVYSVPADGSAAAIQLTNMPSSFFLSEVGAIADGSQVLYLGNLPTTTRLYIVPTDGSLQPRQLNGEMLQANSVLDYLAAPSGNRVVFRADRELDEVFELYSRPADFSAEPVKLSGPMVSGGDVAEYRISPDASRVVYRADQAADEVFELYSAPIDGSSPPVRLNLSRPNADVESDFVIAFDSLGVLFRADQDADEVVELYAVRIDGGAAPMKRNGALVSGGDVLQFRLSTVDDRLIYRADQATNEVIELFSVRAITGGTPVRLNGPLATGGDVLGVQLTLDAQHALYRADQETNGVDGLFVAPADGSAPATLLSAMAQGETLGQTGLPLAPGRALYTAFDDGGKFRLYSAVLDGSRAPVSLFPAADLFVTQTVLDDGTVLALVDLYFDQLELFAVPIDGGAPAIRLNAELISNGNVSSFAAGAGGKRVVYSATQDHPALELFGVPSSGGSVARLSPPVPLGDADQGVYIFVASEDGTRVAYTAPEESTAAHDLFAVTTDGHRNSVRLNPPFGYPVGGIGEFAFSPDGTRVAYELVRNNSTTVELYSAPADRRGAAVRLDVDGPFVSSGSFQVVDRFQFTPDSNQIVYLADQATNDVFELFLVPSDGSAPPVPLHSPYGPLKDDGRFEISADGSWVVYVRNSVSGTELFSLPLDGHQPPARLNTPFPPGGDLGGDQLLGFIYSWAITPDGRVLYYADQDADDVTELYVMPIDGSQAALKLNATLVAGGDVAVDLENLSDNSPYLLSTDGTRVVYRADQVIDGQLELFSVPSTGGAAVKLNGALVAGGNVGHFAIDPSSTRVLYVADQDTNDVSELYSVPLDGSSPAVKLSGALVPGGSLRTLNQRPFAIGSAGRAVFLADASSPLRFELWSVPLDGSSAPLRVNGPLPFLGFVQDYALTSDGTGVVYSANPAATQTFELFHAPLDASTAPRRISGEMAAGGSLLFDLPPFFVLANDLVIYRADQDTDGLPELYATELDWQRGPRRSDPPTRTVTR